MEWQGVSFPDFIFVLHGNLCSSLCRLFSPYNKVDQGNYLHKFICEHFSPFLPNQQQVYPLYPDKSIFEKQFFAYKMVHNS